MIMKGTLFLVTVYLGIALGKPAPSDGNVAAPPVTVGDIDYPNYLGRWYQVGTSYCCIILNMLNSLSKL